MGKHRTVGVVSPGCDYYTGYQFEFWNNKENAIFCDDLFTLREELICVDLSRISQTTEYKSEVADIYCIIGHLSSRIIMLIQNKRRQRDRGSFILISRRHC